MNPYSPQHLLDQARGIIERYDREVLLETLLSGDLERLDEKFLAKMADSGSAGPWTIGEVIPNGDVCITNDAGQVIMKCGPRGDGQSMIDAILVCALRNYFVKRSKCL
jgi:hypothetical protein